MSENAPEVATESPNPDTLQYVEVDLCEICKVPKCYCHLFKLHKVESSDAAESRSDEPKEGKEEANAEADAPEEKQPQKKGKGGNKPIPQVLINVTSRNKRKHITVVSKLLAHGITPKDFARDLSKKYSTSASTKDSPDGTGPCVQLQGDLSSEIIALLKQQYKLTNQDICLKKKEWKSKEQAQKEAEELARSKLGGSAADRAAQFLEEEQSD